MAHAAVMGWDGQSRWDGMSHVSGMAGSNQATARENGETKITALVMADGLNGSNPVSFQLRDPARPRCFFVGNRKIPRRKHILCNRINMAGQHSSDINS